MTECALGKICRYRTENASTDQLPYLSTESMQPNKMGVIPSEAAPSVGKARLFRKGDTLISNIRPYFKKIWQAEYDGCCSADVLVFEPHSCDSDYLYWLLSDDAFFAYMVASSKGTKMPRGDKDAIMRYKVRRQSATEQRRLAAALNPIRELIRINQQTNDYLDDCCELLFDKLIEGRHETTPLSDYLDISSGKRPPIKSHDKTTDAVIPLIGASSQMGYTNETYLNEPALIIGRVGTHGIVQRVNYPCWPSDNTLIIKSEYYETTYQLLRRVDYASLNRGSTQPLITQGDMKNYEVPKLTNEELRDFEAEASSLMGLYDFNIVENKKLGELRDTLLPKLMSGEIDITKVTL